MTKQWVPTAEDRIEELRGEVERLRCDNLPNGSPRDANRLIDRVDRELRQLRVELSDSSTPQPEKVWGTLHTLEEDLDLMVEEDVLVARALEHARSSLTAKDAARAVKMLESPALDAATRVRRARELIHTSHEASAQVHGSERNWFHGVAFAAVMLLISSATLFLFELVFDIRLITVAAVAGAGTPRPSVMLGLVMLAGAVGALLSGTIALYVRRRPAQDNTYWFDPTRRLLLLKVALGPLIALAGVALLSATEIVGDYPSTLALFLVALTFGYSQQAVTQALDRHAHDLLSGKQASTSATGSAGGSTD